MRSVDLIPCLTLKTILFLTSQEFFISVLSYHDSYYYFRGVIDKISRFPGCCTICAGAFGRSIVTIHVCDVLAPPGVINVNLIVPGGTGTKQLVRGVTGTTEKSLEVLILMGCMCTDQQLFTYIP